MGWSSDVHESRKAACLQQARQRYRLRKRGYPVEELANSSVPVLASVVAAFSCGIWWKREGRKLHGRDWKRLPFIKPFLDLLSDQKAPTTAAPRGAARKPPRQLAKPTQAAAAAAAARAGLQPTPPTPLQQRQASNSSAGTSGTSAAGSGGGSGAKKKKSKKKGKK